MFYSRDTSFDLKKEDLHSYTKYGFLTDYINALSLLFPVGEKFFIDAVRNYEPLIQDKRFQAECKEFYKQEARHSREHNKLNKLLETEGLDLKGIEQSIKDRLEYMHIDDEERLLTTICLENITHLLAMFILKAEKYFLKDNAYRDLLIWHATEELEHTHVPRVVAKLMHIPHMEVIKHMPRTIYHLVAQTFKNYKAIRKIKHVYKTTVS